MRIACVLIPRFALALELAVRPAWRGRPVILGGAPGQRRVVVECSAQTERAGVRQGMSLREALLRCHDAVFLEAHPAFYADRFERMLSALEHVSPVVEGAELGCAFVDLAGLSGSGTAAGERALADALGIAVKDAVGLTPRVGIANTRFAAWAAAVSTPRGERARRIPSASGAPVQVVAPGEVASFLAPLSVERLPLFRTIRTAGVAREIPLMVQTLVALAQRRIWLVEGEPYTAEGPIAGGLDLTPEVERAVRAG